MRMKFYLFIALTAVTTASAADWTQWRGPSRDSRIEAEPWSSDLAGLKKAWNTELGEGYSSPIISEDRVFTVETKAKKHEVVRAFDRKTGKQIWEKSWEGSMKVPFFAAKNGSWVRCTPAYDGTHLFVGGMRDVLVCLKAADGSEVWRTDFVEREGTPVPAFGYVSSPLIDGGALFVQAGAAVMKLEKETGKKIWESMKDGRAMYGSAFSSPVIATIGGKRQLVVQTRSKLAGLDLESGDVLWDYTVKAFRGMNILTPTVIGDQIFTSTYGGGTSMFSIASENDSMSASKEWVHKTEGYMSSPVVVGEHVYLHARDKYVYCFGVADGELKWRSDKKFGEYWSMVANGDRILALDQKGMLYLVDANPEKFVTLSEQEVSSQPTWAHVAVCGNEVFVRALKGITKFVWE